MSTVTPPPPHVPTAPVSGLVATTALLLGAPPQTLLALQALQAGQSIQASITAQPATNQVQVQTALGLLTLQTTMALPRGAVLTLVRSPTPPSIPGSTAPVTFQISAVNGKPVAAQTLQQASAPQTVPAPLAAGQTVTATLLRPAVAIAQGTTTQGISSTAAPSTAANPGATPPAQGGTQPTQAQATPAPSPATGQGSAARVLPGTTPGTPASGPGPAAPSAQPAASSQPAGAAPAATTSTPATSTTTLPTTTLPSGTRFSATVQRVETANAAVTTPGTLPGAGAGAKALAPGQVLVGTVTGRTAGGLPIVQTPTATFALGSPGALGAGALGEGAKITFRLDSAPLAPTAAAPGAAALRPLGAAHGLVNAKSWDDLGEALKALAGADPARLTQVAQHTLPQPGAKLTTQMLFFLSALKGGDLRGLFGDSALRVIDKERPGLLSRLGSDFQAMSRLVDEPQQGDWRLALIPLWNGEKLDQLRFFWRGGSPEEGGEETEETRFVFDLDFSQLGHMQIDGLVKAKRRHVDLIVRTDQPLPKEMRAHIAEIFEDARDTLGMGGQVAFQAAPGNFITVPGTEPHAAPHVLSGAELPNLLA